MPAAKNPKLPDLIFDPEQFRFAAEFSPVHIIFTDAEGIILYANPAAEQITGYSRREMIGKPLSMWGGKMPEDFYGRLWQSIKVEKKPFHGELVQKRMNGDAYTAEVWVTPVIVDGVEPSGFVGVEMDVSDRKKLLGDLEESERRFRQMTDNITEAFFLTNPKTFEIFYMSPAFEKIWGIPVADVYADPKTWFSAVFPEDQEKLSASIQSVIAGKESVVDFRIRRADAETRWIRSRVYPVFDEQKQPYRLAGFAEDITLDKEAAEKVRASEERYHTLFSHMQFGVARCKLLFVDGKPDDFTFIDVNEAFEFLTGVKDIVGKNVSVLVPSLKASNPELFEINAAVISSGVPARFESFIPALERWFNVSIFRAETDVDAFVIVIDNITERKNEEKKLSLFRKLIDSSSDGIEVLDPATLQILDVNEKSCKDLGYSREELLGMTGYDIDMVTPAEMTSMQQPRAGKDAALIESVHRRKDGSTYPVELSLTFVQLDRPYLVASVRDITERKQAEVRIKETDTLKNKFIQIVSHQLRTPLSVVRWNLETLLSGEFAKENPENVALVRTSHDATRTVIGRVSDLLVALDIEEGRISLEKEDVDLENLVSSVMGDIKKLCVVRSVTCLSAWEKGLRLPILQLDVEKIRHALMSIVDNAVNYSDEGGTMTVGIEADEKVVHISVTDHGIGIPATEQKHVFTRFFRGSNAPTKMQDASGLGLSIAKYYVEAHGGAIGFASEEGKGSTFWVEFPLSAKR